jgi:Lrp/AsnC family leucine-responsive transcriptional regulator
MAMDVLDQRQLTDDNSAQRQLKRMLDNLDIQILNMIQSNARVSQADVARAVGLAPSAVLERLRKLEARGILTGYAALLDPEAIGLGQLAFVAVRTHGPLDETDRAGELIAEIPGVLEIHHLAGEDCYLVKLRGRDAQHIGQLLRQMKVIPSVTQTRTTMVLSTIKDTPRLPLPGVAGVAEKAEPKKDAAAEKDAPGDKDALQEQDNTEGKEQIAS